MKKTIAIVLALVLMLSLLTACDGDPVDNTTTTTADGTATTTTTTKFSGTTMTFAQGPNQTQPGATTTKPKPTKPKPTAVNGIKVPQVAYDEGAVKLAFQDEFDSMATFDFTNQSVEGKNWYLDGYLNPQQMTSRDFSVKNGVLRIAPTYDGRAQLCTVSHATKKGYLWEKGYAECRMRFEVDNIPLEKAYKDKNGKQGTRVGCPGFWGMSYSDYSTASGVQREAGELDIMEVFYRRGSDPTSGLAYSGALHHHIGPSSSDFAQKYGLKTGVRYNGCNPNAMSYTREEYLLDNQWHTYAALWKDGYIAWYMDGKFMHSVEFADGQMPVFRTLDNETPDASLPSNTNWAGAHTVMNREQQMIFICATSEWPAEFDWVRIWEFE